MKIFKIIMIEFWTFRLNLPRPHVSKLNLKSAERYPLSLIGNGPGIQIWNGTASKIWRLYAKSKHIIIQLHRVLLSFWLQWYNLQILLAVPFQIWNGSTWFGIPLQTYIRVPYPTGDKKEGGGCLGIHVLQPDL